MHAMRSLDDLLAASSWGGALSAEQWQRVRTAIFVRELQPGSYVFYKGDPSNVWAGVIDGLVKAENLSDTGKSVTFATLPAIPGSARARYSNGRRANTMSLRCVTHASR